MDLADLRTLVAVAEHGSFAAVARGRNLDPSSVSRDVARLEAELGVRLFQRSTRRLSPTEAGALYLRAVAPLLEDLEGAALQARDVGGGPRGTVRLASPVSFGLLNVVPLLPDLAARCPDLDLDLVLDDAPARVLDDHLDLALLLGPRPPKSLIAERLAPMRPVICASPAYLARRGRPTCPADLEAHDALVLDYPGFAPRWTLRDPDGFELSVQPRARLRSSNAVALKTAALAGMGVILQARWIVGRELHAGTLVDLFPGHEVTAATFDAPAIWLAYPSRAYLPLKVRAVLDALRAAFQDGAPWERPA